MDANLVLATGFKVDFHKRISAFGFQGLVVGYGKLSVFAVFGGIDDVSLVLCKVRLVNTIAYRFVACGDGNVATVVDVGFPIFLQQSLYFLALGEHHQSRSFAVEAVDDENTVVGILLLDVLAKYAVGGLVALGCCHRKHSRRLVDDNYVAVLVNYCYALEVASRGYAFPMD